MNRLSPHPLLRFTRTLVLPALLLVALVAAASAAAHPAAKPILKVAIVLFDSVEIIDYSGPYEVFGAAGFDVYTVAATKSPITTAMGLTVVPKYSFADAPAPDVLVVPGGGVRAAQHDEPTLAWIRRVTAADQHTMSVCNGAFILASAGLLDGLTVTTTSGNIDRLQHDFPKLKVVSDQRYVDNGHITTAAGLSSGIDGALHVVERLKGRGYAEETALGEEYDWHPTGGFARASLADRQIPELGLDSLGDWECLKTEGTAEHWEVSIRGTSSLSAGELGAQLASRLTQSHWRLSGGAAAAASHWRFTGRDGRPWTADIGIAPTVGTPHAYQMSLKLARAT